MARGGSDVMRIAIEDFRSAFGSIGGLAATGFTIVCLTASTAGAADLRPAYKAPPPPPPAFSWTGCYIGGNGGWIGNDSQATTTVGEPGFPPLAVANATHSYNLKDSGAIGGVQYGCQQQFGQWVVGLDSDFVFTNLKESLTVSHGPAPGPVAPYTETLTQDVSWLSNTRLRLGYSWDRWMVFAAGGLASGRIKSSYVLDPAAAGFDYVGSDKKTRYGWTVGGGVEYALTDNWFLRGEYMFVDLGSRDYFSPINPSTPGQPSFWNTDVETRAHVVRAALSYRFTAAPGLWQWAQGGFRY